MRASLELSCAYTVPPSCLAGSCPAGFAGTGALGCVNLTACALVSSSSGGSQQQASSAASCGACPAGFKGTLLTGCSPLEVDACASSPCYPGVACTDLPDVTSGVTGFSCGSCPPGTAGDGAACAPCGIEASVLNPFAGGTTAARAVSLYSSVNVSSGSAVAAGGALGAIAAAASGSATQQCNVDGGLSFRWTATVYGPAGLAAAAFPLSSDLNKVR